jgi:hypothetical protein
LSFALVLVLVSAPATADELSVSAILGTIRFHPEGEPARIGLTLLSRREAPGWRALVGLIGSYREEYPELAHAAARALADGVEPERLQLAATTYKRTRDPSIRAILAHGLAYGYPAHAALLHKHLRENRAGAVDVLTILAPVLEERELRGLLDVPDLARIAYDTLRRRGLTVRARELLTWARTIARACLDPKACARWAADGDFLIYEAVALTLREKGDEDLRDGAHCLLLTMSGKKLFADPLPWRSWMASHKDRHEPPPKLSPGRIAAAVVRGARHLRRDLMDDGRCVWPPDPNGPTAVGATGMAVLGLIAAGHPKDHPAIEKGVRTTLLVFDRQGNASLPAMGNRKRETYVLSILAMALCEVDAKRFQVPLNALRSRIVHGMRPHGQWGYQCLSSTDAMKPGSTDLSITQYAVLALRALARAGHKIEKQTWQTVEKNLRTTGNVGGGWNYRGSGKIGARQLSMTSAGLSTLAICIEALHGRDAPALIRKDPRLNRARVWLGRTLMRHDYGASDLYAYYGVERGCRLTGTKLFRSKNREYDWYLRGARRLLGKQAGTGHWGFWERQERTGSSYGQALDTSYAILFLTKATATIASSADGVVDVPLKPAEDQAEAVPTEPAPEPPPPPQPPELVLESARVPTCTGDAELRGRVGTARVKLTMDGKPVAVDARGRFRVPVKVGGPRTFAFVATDRSGLLTKREATVHIDNTLPQLELLGPKERHVGKQVLIFQASEALRSLQIGGHVFPANGRVVRAAAKVGEGPRTLTVLATDRAGNASHHRFTIEATNRALVLDGESAVGVDLRERPPHVTVECWVRGDAPARPSAIVANTEGSGFGLFWFSKGKPRPYALLHAAGRYIGVNPKRAWSWPAWTHLALTYDGQALRYFVNGVLQGEAAAAPRTLSPRRLFIGAQPNNSNGPVEFFKGEVDEVRVSRVARYTRTFRPERTFMRDRHTLLLLHFDRPTAAKGLLLDDSGTHHHCYTHGKPRQEPSGAPVVLGHAARELARLLPPLEPIRLTPKEHAWQNARARIAAKSMHMLDVTVRVVSPGGTPYPGVAVRGLHERFDLGAGPVTTNERGEAVLRLPRGPWRLDLVTHESKAGRLVFARVQRAVRAGGVQVIELEQRREVRFRSRLGVSRAAHAVSLAWPDLSFHKLVDVAQGQFEIRTTGDAPMIVQAVRRPAAEGDARDGFVLRRTVGPGLTVVDVEPADATTYVFDGKGVRDFSVRCHSADALPIPLAFAGKDRRTVLFAGLKEIVVGLDVDWGGRLFGFSPRPYKLDGQPRTFLAKPPFRATVGLVRNWRPQYGEGRLNTLSLRVFLTTANGLLVKWDRNSAYTVAWEEVLHGKVRASGTTKPPGRFRTPALDPKEIPNLRYRLQVRGPGDRQDVEVVPHQQTVEVWGGEARTWCFPEVQSNTRHWLLCVDRAIKAYEQTCPVTRHHTDIERSIDMPLPIIGMGGGGGANGWLWLPERSVYGFFGTWYWTGLLNHELGHVHGYGHGNPTQHKIMRQAGRRASRRLWAIRPGMERVPEGDRYRRLLEAVTGGAVAVEQELDVDREIPLLATANDPAGDGVLVPNLEITGNDAMFLWYYRAMHGDKVDADRRKHAGSWSWLLTLKGYTDPEIQIAMYSYAADTSLAWLARMRGIDVHDERIAGAMTAIKAAGGKFVWKRERDGISNRWYSRRYAPTDDLVAEQARMQRELGHRWMRVLSFRLLAIEYLARGDPERGEALVFRALEEAQRGPDGMLEQALEQCAIVWAAR